MRLTTGAARSLTRRGGTGGGPVSAIAGGAAVGAGASGIAASGGPASVIAGGAAVGPGASGIAAATCSIDAGIVGPWLGQYGLLTTPAVPTTKTAAYANPVRRLVRDITDRVWTRSVSGRLIRLLMSAIEPTNVAISEVSLRISFLN